LLIILSNIFIYLIIINTYIIIGEKKEHQKLLESQIIKRDTYNYSNEELEKEKRIKNLQKELFDTKEELQKQRLTNTNVFQKNYNDNNNINNNNNYNSNNYNSYSKNTLQKQEFPTFSNSDIIKNDTNKDVNKDSNKDTNKYINKDILIQYTYYLFII